MHRFTFRVVVLSSLCGAAFSQAQSDCPPAGNSLSSSNQIAGGDFIELQRTKCYGMCPSYTVRIYANGAVEWHGDSFVQVEGEAASHVDAAKAEALIQSAQRHGFGSLCANYSRMITDNPTFFTTLSIAGQSKKVRDYADSAPQWLRDLDQGIDQLADTHRWRHGNPAKELFGEMRLQEDAYMPKPGVTPLMKAAVQQTPGKLAVLWKAGADIDAEDSSGWTAIMYAAQAGKLENLQFLLKSGANPQHRSKAGETVIFAAVSSWYDPATKINLLKAAGTDINAQDKHGTSALMIAAQHFWMPDLIATMMSLGANKGLRNADGQSADDLLDLQHRQVHEPGRYREAHALLALR